MEVDAPHATSSSLNYAKLQKLSKPSPKPMLKHAQVRRSCQCCAGVVPVRVLCRAVMLNACCRVLLRHAQRNLLRVYPTGAHMDSSNFDPTLGWVRGAQLVALNYQTNDMPVWLSHGAMFRVACRVLGVAQ